MLCVCVNVPTGFDRRQCAVLPASVVHAELLRNGTLPFMSITAGLPQLGQGCSRSTLAECVGHKTTQHVAHFAYSRHPHAYIRLGKSKTPCSAQSIGSQAAVSTSEKDFQLWWRSADVKAALSPADFEGSRLHVLTIVAANAHPELYAQDFEVCQLTGRSTLVTPLSPCPAQRPWL